MKYKHRLSRVFKKKPKPENIESGSALESEEVDCFVLDDSAPIDIFYKDEHVIPANWQYTAHCLDERLALILHDGEQLKTRPMLAIKQDSILFIRYASFLPKLTLSDVFFSLSFFGHDSKDETKIAELNLKLGEQSNFWQTATFDLSWLAGGHGFIVVSGIHSGSNKVYKGGVAVSDLCVARKDRLSKKIASSFQQLRTTNEIVHFSQTYQHNTYADVHEAQAIHGGETNRETRQWPTNKLIEPQMANPAIGDLSPIGDETVFNYANRLLESGMKQKKPDFIKLLQQKARNGRKLRVLSLCCGAARVEAGFAAAVSGSIEWSLLDINKELLETAASQFPKSTKLNLIEANANELEAIGEKWDIIICVSALHHLIELEKVSKFIYDSLEENGEFWSIAENIGRNGNMLHPDAKAFADNVFSMLPVKYRFNAHTQNKDQLIPNNDYSVGCFEGIRSEEIESSLDRWFIPVDEYRANCFLWRMTNLAYSDNFDLSSTKDRQWLKKIASLELEYFRSGGQPTELCGVYKRRFF